MNFTKSKMVFSKSKLMTN